MKDCISVECIYNDLMKKGLCVGIASNTRSYDKDVVRMCWVERKPTLKKPCDIKMQAQCTPAEAVGIGVALIRSSIIGETLLKNMEGKAREKSRESQE